MIEQVECLAKGRHPRRLPARVKQRAGGLEGQPRRLVVPGQPRADPLAPRRILPGLPLQAGGHRGVPPARSIGSSSS